MVSTDELKDSPWLGIIGRCLAYLCMQAAELEEGGLTEKAEFLSKLGLPRDECAKMLDTTEEYLRTSSYRDKKKRRGKRGAKKKGAEKASQKS